MKELNIYQSLNRFPSQRNRLIEDTLFIKLSTHFNFLFTIFNRNLYIDIKKMLLNRQKWKIIKL
jgi:hypothetical protein